MAAKPETRTDIHPREAGSREEARHLAEEAVEEMNRGNKEEAKFVLDEARDLDKSAVDQVLREENKKGG